jgi:hypothetical protein
MNALMLAAALMTGQVDPPPRGSATPAPPSVDGNWTVVHMAQGGQTIPPAGAAQVVIRGGTLSFSGTGVQYPSLRLDFGPSSTLRASTTLRDVAPGGLPEPPVATPPAVPGARTGRSSVGPGTGSVERAEPPRRPESVGSGAGSGRTGPLPSTMNGVYVLSGEYLVLSLGTTPAAPYAGSGQSGAGTTGAVTSTGGTPRGTPSSAGPPALVLILRRAAAEPGRP